MATTVFLIRHAAHALQGRTLVGRTAGVVLSDTGQRQAAELAIWLAEARLGALYSGPLERARATAAPIAARLGLKVAIVPELDELDCGEWTNRTLAELERSELWRRYNTYRSGTRMPGGEHMREVQTRVVGLIERLCARHPDERIGLVSHGDVIRAALLYHLGMPLDLVHRIEVAPASVSIILLGDEGPQVLLLNGGPGSPM